MNSLLNKWIVFWNSLLTSQKTNSLFRSVILSKEFTSVEFEDFNLHYLSIVSFIFSLTACFHGILDIKHPLTRIYLVLREKNI